MCSALKDCRFCLGNGLLDDAPLYRNAAFYVLGMLDPARAKAVMIVPLRHSETPFDMSAEEYAHLPDALAFAKAHLAQFSPDGFTIGWNVGAAAGQTVFHTHLHVICRFADAPVAGEGLAGMLRLATEAETVASE